MNVDEFTPEELDLASRVFSEVMTDLGRHYWQSDSLTVQEFHRYQQEQSVRFLRRAAEVDKADKRSETHKTIDYSRLSTSEIELAGRIIIDNIRSLKRVAHDAERSLTTNDLDAFESVLLSALLQRVRNRSREESEQRSAPSQSRSQQDPKQPEGENLS